MARTIGIGHQDFATIRQNNYFYIDKTDFIRQWWSSGDSVTLIARPRRFGKTLNMSMIEQFFSLGYAGSGSLFGGLTVWQEEEYRGLQGTYPVISLSFAEVKETTYIETKKKVCQLIVNLYEKYRFLLDGNSLSDKDKAFFLSVSADMEEYAASMAIKMLAGFLYHYFGKKVVILLDEYDTPMQESYVHGYWNELMGFMRSLFNSTFKTNEYLERAIMTGITRVSKESVFSDLNNLVVVTATSDKYADCFGFTQDEVFSALDEYGLSDRKQEVKDWYDGFTFGSRQDIYNPWSIINYLDRQKLAAYWANTSSNSLVSALIRESSKEIKLGFEILLQGGSIKSQIDEQIVYNQLDDDEQAIWSLLLASGYLKVKNLRKKKSVYGYEETEYELQLTNLEVRLMFASMIRGWFGRASSDYNDFVRALLDGNVKEMNAYMNRVALTTFSYFDTGKRPSGAEPERFYHGFVLGLMVELADRYLIQSNRESGFGRYDVMLEPRGKEDDAIILEFKVFDPEEEECLQDTVRSALKQICRQRYDALLEEEGISADRIRQYGFAFYGKKVLIGGEADNVCAGT